MRLPDLSRQGTYFQRNVCRGYIWLSTDDQTQQPDTDMPCRSLGGVSSQGGYSDGTAPNEQ